MMEDPKIETREQTEFPREMCDLVSGETPEPGQKNREALHQLKQTAEQVMFFLETALTESITDLRKKNSGLTAQKISGQAILYYQIKTLVNNLRT